MLDTESQESYETLTAAFARCAFVGTSDPGKQLALSPA
jgi:hypothetical protein